MEDFSIQIIFCNDSFLTAIIVTRIKKLKEMSAFFALPTITCCVNLGFAYVFEIQLQTK